MSFNITPHNLIRYKTIDECLHNKHFGCTFEELQEACTEALEEKRKYAGDPVSRKTLFNDLKVMKEFLKAPIQFNDNTKKYYYSDRTYRFSRQKIPYDANLLKEIKDFILKNNEIGRNSKALFFVKKLTDILSELEGPEPLGQMLSFEQLSRHPLYPGSAGKKKQVTLKWGDVLALL